MIRLTVFTPAYNRAHTLPRTYESLCNQKCKDFCWLIIDDGSTDDTEQLVKGWMEKDNGFEIQYIYKENGGMHTAHNMAYENITTELNVCVDSDDCMAEDGVAKILKKRQWLCRDYRIRCRHEWKNHRKEFSKIYERNYVNGILCYGWSR